MSHKPDTKVNFLGVKISDQMLKRLEDRTHEQQEKSPGRNVNLSDVVRDVLSRGLDCDDDC